MTSTSGALRNVCRLRSLLPLGDFELHRIAFLQALVALGGDRAVMYKNIGAIRAPNEPVTLRVIEPLYGAFQTFHVNPLFPHVFQWGAPRRARIECILERLGWGCQDETVRRDWGAEAGGQARLVRSADSRGGCRHMSIAGYYFPRTW
jgi:hypothetical protein